MKCRKVGAANWGNKSKKEETEYELDEKCWKGYEKKGMKTMFGKRYPNCVKKEETEVLEGKYSSSVRATYGGKTETFPVETYKKKSKKVKNEQIDEYYGMAGGMGGSLSKRLRDERFKSLPKTDAEAKKKEEVKEGDGDPCWDTHKQVGMKKKGNRMVPNCVPKNKVKEETEDSLRDRRMERGGVDGNTRYDRAPKAPNTKKFGTGKTALQKDMEKKHGKGKSAMDIVRAEIRAKHGKGAIMDTKKK